MIHSDRGTHFTANPFYEVCKVLGISHSYSPAYHPESNGMVERLHGTLKSILKKLCDSKQDQWEINLPSALFAMRTSKNRTTGLSLFVLIFGRHPNTPLEAIFGLPLPERKQYTSEQEYADAISSKVLTSFNFARNNMGRAITRMRRNYCKKAPPFIKGDNYWTGPWTLDKQIKDVVVKILPDVTWVCKQPEIVTIDRLKKFFPSKNADCRQDAEADLSMPGI